MMSHEEVHDGVRQHTGIYPYSRRISPPPPSSVPTTRPVPGPSAPSTAPAAKLFAASWNTETWRAAGAAGAHEACALFWCAIELLCLRECTGGSLLEARCGAGLVTEFENDEGVMADRALRRVHSEHIHTHRYSPVGISGLDSRHKGWYK